mgnify:CR=1 FL=1
MINKRYIKTAGAIISAAVLLVSAGCGSRNNVPGGSVQAESIAGNDKGSTSVSTADVTLTRDSEYPDYYEQEVRKTIQTLDDTITGDSVSYIFITDTHLDSNEASTTAAYRMYNAVVDVANNSDVDFVCVGGDIYDGRHAEENGKANAMQIIRNVAEILSACNKPVFSCTATMMITAFRHRLTAICFTVPTILSIKRSGIQLQWHTSHSMLQSMSTDIFIMTFQVRMCVLSALI